MDLPEAIKARHSVRSYTDKKIEGEELKQLQSMIDECNHESGLNIQLCVNEPQAFASMMARVGKFKNVNNYIALVGKNDDNLEEKCGYYGEKIVLKATQLGLNTCWVAMTYNKNKCPVTIAPGEKLKIVISIGYGTTNGVSHKVKPVEELSNINDSVPTWFLSAVEAVRLAPTANNQQKFRFELHENAVKALPGSGFYTKLDLGIAKYHFEIGADNKDWNWL